VQGHMILFVFAGAGAAVVSEHLSRWISVGLRRSLPAIVILVFVAIAAAYVSLAFCAWDANCKKSVSRAGQQRANCISRSRGIDIGFCPSALGVVCNG